MSSEIKLMQVTVAFRLMFVRNPIVLFCSLAYLKLMSLNLIKEQDECWNEKKENISVWKILKCLLDFQIIQKKLWNGR